jgi:hypothetical protein
MPSPPPRQIDSWETAEANAAAWMQWWGHPDAVVTPSGTDGGVDVRASRALAQVKYEAHQVGRPALQRLVGSRPRAGQQQLFFFSGAGFSDPAIAYADDWDIALFKYALNGSMIPLNTAGRRLLRAVADRENAARMAEDAARRVREEEQAARRLRKEERARHLREEAEANRARQTEPEPSTGTGMGNRRDRPEADGPLPERSRNAQFTEERLARKRAQMMRSTQPLKRRRTGPWLLASCLCLGLAIYALVDGLRHGTPGWVPAMAVLCTLFFVFGLVAGAGDEHNKLVDDVEQAKWEAKAERQARRSSTNSPPQAASR